MNENLTIPDQHKEEVRRRMESQTEEGYIPWEIVKAEIKRRGNSE